MTIKITNLPWLSVISLSGQRRRSMNLWPSLQMPCDCNLGLQSHTTIGISEFNTTLES